MDLYLVVVVGLITGHRVVGIIRGSGRDGEAGCDLL